MEVPLRSGPYTVRGTDLIVATITNNNDKDHSPSHGLRIFNLQTGKHHLVDSYLDRRYDALAMAHLTDRIILASHDRGFAEVRNVSQGSTTRSMPQQDPVLDLSISVNGETLLVAYSDRFEVQTLRGDVTLARPAIWPRRSPSISLSHDGAFIAARTLTDTGADGVTLWRVASGREVFRPCVTYGRITPVFSHTTRFLAYDDEDGRKMIIWDTLEDAGTLTFSVPPQIAIFADVLRFTPDDKTLLPTRGSIRIDAGSRNWEIWHENVPFSDIISSELRYQEHWIMSDQQHLIWVPSHYRPTSWVGQYNLRIMDRTVAFWNANGLVVMRIADTVIGDLPPARMTASQAIGTQHIHGNYETGGDLVNGYERNGFI
jgi:WD40 repeat protein